MNSHYRYDINSLLNALSNHALQYDTELMHIISSRGHLTTLSDVEMALKALLIPVVRIVREGAVYRIIVIQATHPIRIKCMQMLCKLFGPVGTEFEITPGEPQEARS